MLLCSKIDDFSQVLIKFEGKTYLHDRLKSRISKFGSSFAFVRQYARKPVQGKFSTFITILNNHKTILTGELFCDWLE